MADADPLTTILLGERLAGTRLPEDPTDVVLPPGSERWPADMRKQLTTGLTPAGVLIPVFERNGTLTVLLTQRSADLKHHAGQISFPGGRMETGDRDIAHTALRETHEEVGIRPEEVSVIGYLDPMPTVTGYAVTPVVGLVAGQAEVSVDHTEVEYAFEVPLTFFVDERNEMTSERDIHGWKVPIIEFQYDGQRIWGATAHILVELRKILKNQ
jgi:8-oxo-dGTP pyrophosphatase MutT (NUDIX family)